MDHRHTFLTTQGHGGLPRMSDQPYAGATSETAQTWKRIHTKHTPIGTNKANIAWWLRRPNDIRGPCGPKVSRHLFYRWGKTPKKTSPRKPVPTGDRTRARCVTSAHATTCSTAVDLHWSVTQFHLIYNFQFHNSLGPLKIFDLISKNYSSQHKYWPVAFLSRKIIFRET